MAPTITFVGICTCMALQLASAGRPNIVLIMSDDQDGNRVRQDYADYLPMHRFLNSTELTKLN